MAQRQDSHPHRGCELWYLTPGDQKRLRYPPQTFEEQNLNSLATDLHNMQDCLVVHRACGQQKYRHPAPPSLSVKRFPAQVQVLSISQQLSSPVTHNHRHIPASTIATQRQASRASWILTCAVRKQQWLWIRCDRWGPSGPDNRWKGMSRRHSVEGWFLFALSLSPSLLADFWLVWLFFKCLYHLG